uniref:Uncharacterized protein n=1 Tax=Palpitomonas bilix TaxID=652834 RepID=A0A7S3DCK3_9EUKA
MRKGKKEDRSKLPTKPSLFFDIASVVDRVGEGDQLAALHLATFYQHGWFTKRDEKRAAEIMVELASMSHLGAKGMCYLHGYDTYKKDEEEAAKCWIEGTRKGDLFSMEHLGHCYERGIGVKQSEETAVVLYQSAMNEGYAPATHRLATCFERGVGVKKDVKRAFLLYGIAGDQIWPDSIAAVGRCFATGLGTAVDHKRASDHYHSAAQAGHEEAIAFLYAKEKDFKHFALYPTRVSLAAVREKAGFPPKAKAYKGDAASLPPGEKPKRGMNTSIALLIEERLGEMSFAKWRRLVRYLKNQE